MSQRVSEKGCRRKTSVSGRPTPLFLLSHGSSVPSGVHTVTETPNQPVCPRRRQPLSHCRKSPVGPEENQLSGLKVTDITMSNNGVDCFFFYYSTCAKGDSCPFRHCEAALGNETVCNLWQEGRCFRTVCKFRHMEITKNRKEIPCYWENQAAGCQKPHCAFLHEKPRYVDGMFVPPNKNPTKNMEPPHEEPAPAPAAPAAANPQLRGVIKSDAQEPVASPTHPPVVINPVDDDEDEDEEGEAGLSPRKLPRSDNSLNFGVSTLEEIRLRKALKASMKKAGYPIQSADLPDNREKENIQSFLRPGLGDAPLVSEESGRPRGSVAQRLGRKMPRTDVPCGETLPLKTSLAVRLGKVVDEEVPSTKVLKPIKERLGLSAGSGTTQSAEPNMEPKKASEQIRIKTLEEIRQEKAAKSQSLSKDGPSASAPETNNTKSTKNLKRAIAVKDHSLSHVKTFSEILHAKKKRLEEEKQAEQETSQAEADAAEPETQPLGGVRVKTLEEIRREKAARSQGQQAPEAEHTKSCNTEENGVKKPRLLRIKKLASQGDITVEKSAQVSEAPLKAAAAQASVANGNGVKVKTFEEIMQEKRLRKQEMEQQEKGSPDGARSQKRPAETTLKRKVPAKVSLSSPGSSSQSSAPPGPDTTPSAQKVPVRKLIPLRAKAASSANRSTAPGTRVAAVASAPVEQNSLYPESLSESPSSSSENPDKSTGNSGSAPTKQVGGVPRGPAAQGPAAGQTMNVNQKEHTTDTKVRPKLNVKPSVMKPAVHVKPGQKRRGAECSAVAAVKPLSSAATVLKGTLQEKARKDRQVFPSSSAEAQLSSALPCSPSTLLDSGSGSSPLREELQTVPVSTQNQETKTCVHAASAAAKVACTVPQSPVLKTPTQPKSRRGSVAASRTASSTNTSASTSAVDDFEELINEFTDDHLEHEDMDPDMGEDDLLQKLSEMIDI